MKNRLFLAFLSLFMVLPYMLHATTLKQSETNKAFPVVKSVKDLSNQKIYTLQSKRGWMTSKGDFAASTARSGQQGGYDVPECQWAIHMSDYGNYYLYNLHRADDLKFLGFQKENNQPIRMVAKPVTDKLSFMETGDANYPLMAFFEDVASIYHDANVAEGLVASTSSLHAINDEGNMLQISEVGDLTPEVLTEIETKVKAYEDALFGNHVVLPKKGPNGGAVLALSSLELTNIHCYDGPNLLEAKKDLSYGGKTLTMADTTYASGVGVHAHAHIYVRLNDAVTHFHCVAGIDDEVDEAAAAEERIQGDAMFEVVVLDENGFQNRIHYSRVRYDDPSGIKIDVDCRGWKYLVIYVTGGDGGELLDHVDIANAYFEYDEANTARPEIIPHTEFTPRLNCADKVFSQPNVRFVHKVRTADPTAKLSVDGLPEGLTWNAQRQIVEGVVRTEDTLTYKAHVVFQGKTYNYPITLIVSSKLQQPLPVMGWSSRNLPADQITENMTRVTSEKLNKKEIVASGYTMFCLDDMWQNDHRASDGKPLANQKNFKNGSLEYAAGILRNNDMYLGIYSCTADKTPGGGIGSNGMEVIDAEQYYRWGVNYLRYELWNGRFNEIDAQNHFRPMGQKLNEFIPRIVFNVCEGGKTNPWMWGPEVGASSWRVTENTRNGWNGKDGGVGILQSIERMKNIWAYGGPNRFNDADIMYIGVPGDDATKPYNQKVEKAGLSFDECQTQFALWCMWSSPLLLSLDPNQDIDPKILDLITDKELIAINQDRMGQQAEYVGTVDDMAIFIKDLENGDLAMSFTNLGDIEVYNRTFSFDEVGLTDQNATYNVHQLLSDESDVITTDPYLDIWYLKPHGTIVYRLSKIEREVNFSKIEGNAISGVAGSHIATFSSTTPVEIPAGVTAYHVVGGIYDGQTSVKLEEIKNIIPANQGVILVSNATSAVMKTVEEAGVRPASTSLRATGNTTAKMSRYFGNYILATVNGTTQFYKAKGEVGPNKAYLFLSDSQASSIGMNFGSATGIEAVEAEVESDAPVYDLSGRRVNAALKSGVYIKEGKKFLVK